MKRLQAELGFSSKNMAHPRRRDPLPAALDRSELPAVIRRPANAPVGGGHFKDIPIIFHPLGSGGAYAWTI